MKIRFVKLTPEAKAPVKGSSSAAVYDLYATKVDYEANDGGPTRIIVHTGLAVEIPDGYYGDIRARSSVCNTGLILSNGCGVIDSDYRGEIKAVFYPVGDRCASYEKGERCLQMIISPVPNVEYIEVDSLSETQRGKGGYGSTGK